MGEPNFRRTIHKDNQMTSFLEGWRSLNGRFTLLENFCGGLALAFPGTCTVESDFSVVKWEKDNSRVRLSDFSLEGILHAKQFRQI